MVGMGEALLIREGVVLLIQLVAGIAKMSGTTPEEIKKQFDESYEGLKQRDPSKLKDV